VRLRSELEVQQANEKARTARAFADSRDEHWEEVLRQNIDVEIQKRVDVALAYEDKLSQRERVFTIVRFLAAAAVGIDIVEALALLHVL
jgi:hypothetical protein